ncbi:hypothetical protein ACLI1A_14340 [Flavobacterium sp. RHBU_3]|uniref:hypothetical protein n=1 Tax=Flavobacterium sp. RHBU_3 TaxID=3391184 RepID=UPI003984D5CC
MKLLKLLAVFLLGFTLYAQEGANDATFNPADTSIGASTDGAVQDFLVCPDGKLIIYGYFEKYHDVDSHHIVRINGDKSIDTSFAIGSALNGWVSAAALQSDGKIVIAGGFTLYNDTPVGNVIRLNSDGSLDTSFTSGVLNNSVYEIKVQADDKLLVCGSFTTYNDVVVKMVIRLNTDGTLDPTFNLAVNFSNILDIALQEDGKVIVAGSQLRRFNTDGSTDSSFTPVYTDYGIRAVELQSDGKIVIGGSFETLYGVSHKGIARINANGTKDTTFAIGTGMYATVTDIAIQPDGKIIFVGLITNLGDYYARGSLRLNEDGTVDTTFTAPQTDPVGSILAVELTENNIYLGGMFINYNNTPANYIFPLNYDGTPDYTGYVQPTGANNPVTAIAYAGNGNMLVGGSFTYYNGEARNRLALINEDGELLDDFNPGEGPNGNINGVVRQSDGKYIVYGDFTTYNGVARKYVARINADGSLDMSYDLSGLFSGPYSQYLYGGKLQSDNKLLLYGGLTVIYGSGTVNTYLVCRINTDGTLDESFQLFATYFFTSGYSPLEYLEILPDGKMLLSLNGGTNGLKIARANSDGSVDNSFPFIGGDYLSNTRKLWSDNNGKYITSQRIYNGGSVPNTTIYRRMNANGIYDTDFELPENDYGSLSFIQGDGKMFFIKNDGLTSSFKRFNADGTLDETFGDHTIYEYSPKVNAVLYQQDKVVIGGRFSRYDGNHRSNIARFNSTGAALQTATPEVVVKPSLIALKKNNTVDVECPTMALSSVTVYDLSGRLVASANKLQDNKVSLKYAGVTDSVLIVQAKLQDGSILVKKIM